MKLLHNQNKIQKSSAFLLRCQPTNNSHNLLGCETHFPFQKILHPEQHLGFDLGSPPVPCFAHTDTGKTVLNSIWHEAQDPVASVPMPCSIHLSG